MEIPRDFDFATVKSLSTEGREKLVKVKPRSIGQASPNQRSDTGRYFHPHDLSCPLMFHVKQPLKAA